MSNKAVIIVDMLNGFVTGDLKTERAATIVPNLKNFVEKAREHSARGATITRTYDSNTVSRLNLERFVEFSTADSFYFAVGPLLTEALA